MAAVNCIRIGHVMTCYLIRIYISNWSHQRGRKWKSSTENPQSVNPGRKFTMSQCKRINGPKETRNFQTGYETTSFRMIHKSIVIGCVRFGFFFVIFCCVVKLVIFDCLLYIAGFCLFGRA